MGENNRRMQAHILLDPEVENPRYTIWRALNPGAPLFEFMAWIASNVRRFEAETKRQVAADQDGFTEWLCDRYGARFPSSAREA